MEVNEAKRVLHLRLSEATGDLDDLRSRQAELSVLAGTVGPLAFAGGGELDAQADVGLDAHASGDADDRVDLGELFDDDDGLLTEAAAHQGELDVFLVLVTVADQECLAVLEEGEGDDELRLRTSFEAEIIFFTCVEDLFDHFAELVDLDREDASVATVVVLFLDGAAEGFVDLRHAVAEQVLDANRERGLQAGSFDFLDDVRNTDFAVVAFRVHAEVTLRVHGEVVTSPSFEAVIFFGVFGSPGLRFAHVGREVDFLSCGGKRKGKSRLCGRLTARPGVGGRLSDGMSAEPVIRATIALRKALEGRSFPAPADFVYQPLDYAWASHEAYLRRFAAAGPRKVLFLGMNPGPFGMAQTGVPFGEIAAVRDWMGLEMPVGRPEKEHPGKKVTGFACHRSEVSGRRLWGLFQERFGKAEAFFAEHLVHNYCPLLFLENTKQGRNVIPEELPNEVMAPVNKECDKLLRVMVETLGVSTVVGVGGYAETRAREALDGLLVKYAKVPHPSPANPVANRGWSAAATKALVEQGVWS